MFTINLHNLIFHAFHGLYDEERMLGNEFIVNVSIGFNAVEQVNELHQTMNYVAVYDIIKQHMQQPTPLLETLTQQMAKALQAYDTRMKSISISIEKKNPPITQIQGSVSIVYKKEYK